jgi:hypothetical protein
MNANLARLLTRLYPRGWRERYGKEFEAHLESGPNDLRTIFNTVWGAAREHAFPARAAAMEHPVVTFGDVMQQPSALIPMGMSMIGLTIVVSFLLTNGIVHPADEGWEAHIWQILMAGQFPIVLFFAIRWLPRAPRQALSVLALQAGAALASMAPVFFFHL